MTFPREDLPGPEGFQGQDESEAQLQTGAFGPPARRGDGASSEADLFAPEPKYAAGGYDAPPAGLAARLDPPVDDSVFDLQAMQDEGLNLGTAPPRAVPGRAGHSGRRVRRVAWELVQTLVLALLIFLMVRAVVQNFRVEGPSMEPGLHNGQYLLVNKAVYFKLDLGTLGKYLPFIDAEPGEQKFLFHGPQRGDVIVFRYPRDPERDFIKRVIGVPGDRVRIEGGVVYVNDVEVEESYIIDNSGRDVDEQVVPPKNYFVLGDNRPNSSDSRSWGYVPEENIIGKALLSYWPLSDVGGVGNTRLDLGLIRVPVPW